VQQITISPEVSDALSIGFLSIGNIVPDNLPDFVSPDPVEVDPEDDPVTWERQSGVLLENLAPELVADVRSAMNAHVNAIHIRGLHRGRLPPPSPSDARWRNQDLRALIASVFGIIQIMGADSFAYTSENEASVIRNLCAPHDPEDECSLQEQYAMPWRMDAAHRPLTERHFSAITTLSPAPRWLVFGTVHANPHFPIIHASIDEVAHTLDQQCLRILQSPHFSVENAKPTESSRITCGVPILIPDRLGGFYSRYDESKCTGETFSAQYALDILSAALANPIFTNHIDLRYGDVVVLDNWKSVHKRVAHRPRRASGDLWLIHVYAKPKTCTGFLSDTRRTHILL
jgi:hypothetical protein